MPKYAHSAQRFMEKICGGFLWLKTEDSNNEEFSFIKEKIKKQPFYQTRRFRQLCYWLLVAVLCGVVASFVFVKVQPFMEQTFGQDEKNEMTIPRDNDEPDEVAQEPAADPVIITEPQELELSDYQKLYTKLKAVAGEVNKSLVTVMAASSDTDWFNEIYESRREISGLLVGNNGVELLVLIPYEPVKDASLLQVTFVDGTSQEAVLKNYDRVTDLAIVSVNLAAVDDSTMEAVKIADLGSSRNLKAGDNVIAVGSPAGFAGSLKLGNLVAPGHKTSVIDGEYRLLITDMERSDGGTGVLVNLDGQVIGLIEDTYLHASNERAMTAYAISDMKAVIEHLSNSQDLVYMGIKGSQVTAEIAEIQGIPMGVYVSNVEPDSPALNGGLQAGDVITEISGKTVAGVTEIQEMLLKFSKDQVIRVKVMRQGKEEYKEITCSVKLDVLK